jgi:malate dehydrogenase (oxaloacetate-decarboxylating)(NADP+)
VAGKYIMMTKKGPLFLADTTVNFNPTAEELANIAIMVAKEVRSFGMVPNIAMLSYSNFGSSNSPEAKLVAKARDIVKQIEPDLVIDGEMQANVAFNKEILKDNYPFSELVDKDVNVLIFPNLASGNVTYNILQEVVGYETIGPVLLGLNKPVHILQLGSHVRSIYNMVLIAVVDAQMKCKKKSETQPSEKRRWRKPKLPAAESK